MDSNSGIQLEVLIGGRSQRNRFNITPESISKSLNQRKLSFLITISFFELLLHAYYSMPFLIELGSFLSTIILFICKYYESKSSNKSYSFGYLRSSSIGTILSYCILLMIGIGNFLIVMYFDITNSS